MTTVNKRSPLWQYFEICEDNSKFAICLLCKSKISRGGEGKKAGTSAMKNHIKSKHADEYLNLRFAPGNNTVGTREKNKVAGAPSNHFFNSLYQLKKALLGWCRSQLCTNAAVNGPTLEAAANHLAMEIGIQNFTCSQEWIQLFMKRHITWDESGRATVRGEDDDTEVEVNQDSTTGQDEAEDEEFQEMDDTMDPVEVDPYTVNVKEEPRSPSSEPSSEATPEQRWAQSATSDQRWTATNRRAAQDQWAASVATVAPSRKRAATPSATYDQKTQPTMDGSQEGVQEDVFDKFGKYVAAQVRTLPPRAATLLQLEIQNAITKAVLSCMPADQS